MSLPGHDTPPPQPTPRPHDADLHAASTLGAPPPPVDDEARTIIDMSQKTDDGPREGQGAGQLPRVERDAYVIAGQFARGGIGRILRAHDPILDRPVALKELLVHGRPVDEERFVREVLLTARLQHPGVVPVYAAGRWPSGEPFFAMKLVSGRSFDKLVAEADTLAARLALLPHVLAIAETVAYAHSRGIIHRDLKPHNVLVGAFGETVVIDWGLAKVLGVDDPRASAAAPPPEAAGKDLTFVGAVVGTPGYMSPEQAEGADVDTGTDVYALGVLLYQLLSGRLPYDADGPMELVYKTSFEAPVPLRSREPDVPDELVDIVDKAMARDRARRYPSAREFAEDLRRFQTGQIVGAHRYTAWERVRRFVRRHRAVLGLALVSLIVIVVVTALYFVEIREQRDVAERARDRAEIAEHQAQIAQAEAERRADNLSHEQARLLVDEDPIEAMRLLHGVSAAADWKQTRQIAGDLIQRGFPRALRGHRGAISRVAFSPDSAVLATTSDDCTLRLWDMSTWTSRVFHGHTGEVWRAAWSPDQRLIATTSRDGSVRVWDVQSGETRQVFAHGASVRNIIFGPDGNSVYSADDALLLRRWDLASGEPEVLDRCYSNTIPWAPGYLGCIDPDRNEAHMHDLRTGERIVITGSAEVQFQQAGGLSSDGRWFAVNTAGGGVWLWDRQTGSGRALPWPPVPGAGGTLKGREIRFGPESDQFAAPASATYLRHYDITNDHTTQFAPHEGYTRRAAFSPDGTRLASVGGDNRVGIWDVATATSLSLQAPAYMIDAQFSPDGRYLAAVGNDPRVLVWTIESFTPEQYVPPEPILSGTLAVAIAAARAIFATARGLHLLDLEHMQATLLPPVSLPVRRLALAGDGRHALVLGDGGELLGVELPGGAVIAQGAVGTGCLDFHEAHVAPDGPRFVLPCEDGRVLLVDLDAGEPVRQIASVRIPPPALLFADRGPIVVGDGDRLLRFDADGRLAGELLRMPRRIDVMRAVPGTREFLFTADNHVEHVDLDGRRFGELPGHGLQVSAVFVSGDNRWLLTVTRDNVLRMFARDSLALRIELSPIGLIEGIAAMSHDGSRVAVALSGGDVLLWDLGDEGDPLAAQRDPRRLRGIGTAAALTIDADGRSVTAVDREGHAIRWRDTLPTDAAGLREFIATHADPAEPPAREVGCAPRE